MFRESNDFILKISGWIVHEDEEGKDKWELIGERDPLLPQNFQPVNNTNLVIRQGDIVKHLDFY